MSGNIFNHEQQPVFQINANSFVLVADSIKHSLTTKTTAQPPNQHFNMHSISFLATLVCVFSATIMAIPTGTKGNGVTVKDVVGDQVLSYYSSQKISEGSSVPDLGSNHVFENSLIQLQVPVLSNPLNSNHACGSNIVTCCTTKDKNESINVGNISSSVDIFKM